MYVCFPTSLSLSLYIYIYIYTYTHVYIDASLLYHSIHFPVLVYNDMLYYIMI